MPAEGASRTAKLAVTAAAAALLAAAAVLVLRSPGQKPPEAPPAFPLTIRDDERVTATVTDEPQRIVSFAPQFTETLFALGIGRRIVGVSAAESYPPEATAIRSVVSEDGLSPDVVRIGELAPDLVLAAAGGEEWKTPLRNTGTLVFTLIAASLDDAFRDIRTLGRLTGKRVQADRLAARLEAEAASVAGTVAGRPRPKVFFETFYPPLVGASPLSFVGDLVERAGGRLVAAPSPGEYAEWSMEQLVAADPDVYLAPKTSARSPADVAARKGFEALRAVREGRVFVLDDDLVFRPGPRLVEGLRAIAAALHGERL